MTLADSYAKALYSLVSENPGKQTEYLKGLEEALKRRGHEKLLPRIFKSYESLELQAERRKTQATVTPEKERNRILLELYHKLVSSN
jgi:F0F1-type ATP synthase delta subunit